MKKTLAAFAVFALFALPTLAGQETVYSGIDVWHTPSDGSSYADFYLEPIPADFFCPGSAAWSGRIAFGGEPLATLPEGVLGNGDTVLLRLDDADFDQRGVASTRLQVQAMNLVGLETIKTSCGAFSVRTVLDGVQPITDMKIVRSSQKDGHFVAPVAVNIRLVFAPVSKLGQTVELSREIVFAPSPNARWTSEPVDGAVTRKSSLVVDSDSDGRPDLPIPGKSNFTTGLGAGMKLLVDPTIPCHEQELMPGEECESRPEPLPHTAPTHVHNVQTGTIIYFDDQLVPFEEQ